MFDKSKIKIGDAMQFKIRGKNDWLGRFIGFFSHNGKYAHSAIYVGWGFKAEAHAGKVFSKVKIDPKEYKYIDIWRLDRDLLTEHRDMLRKSAGKIYGKSYDNIGLVGTVRSYFGKLFNWTWLSNSDPILNDNDKFFCSEAVGWIYTDALGVDLAPKVHEEATQPSDLNRGGLLRKVS